MKKQFTFCMLMLVSFCFQNVLADNPKSVLFPNGSPESTALLAPTVNFTANYCDQLANGYLLASFTNGTGSNPSFSWEVNNTPVTGSGSFMASGPLMNLKNGDVVEVTITNGAGSDSDQITIDCDVVLNLKFFLEGYYDTNISRMRTVLYNQGATSDINANLCDQVTIEVHEDNCAAALVASCVTHVSIDGDAVATFPGLVDDDYYIVIRHRNTITTWSAAAETIELMAANSYDFTTDDSQAFADNMVEVESGVWACFTGDANQDDFVDVTDYSLWETDSNNFESGWFATDFNGDGNVDTADYPIWEANNNLFVYAWRPECAPRLGASGETNPVKAYEKNDFIHFNVERLTDGRATVKVYDLSGNLVRETSVEAVNQSFDIERQNLGNGVYIVRITNNGNTYTTKLSIE